MNTQAENLAVPREFLELLGKENILDLRLGDNVEKNMTVLFSDIRDFTSLSEEMTPQENFSFINGYLSNMEPVLFNHHGFVDKYIGDAIMALFPKSADDALRAAIAMLEQLRKYNASAERVGEKPVRIGIGLNTGLMMVGTVGGSRRMETTVIGDAVNLASRLESMTKTYGVELLISEHSYYGLKRPTDHDIRFVDRVRVKGKDQPQSVYEVFDADPQPIRAAKKQSKRIFEEALACYHYRDIVNAQKLLQQCLEICPDDIPAQVYIARCQRFMETGVHEGTGETEIKIAWGSEFEIGHPVIDAQHQELLKRVESFAETMHTCKAGGQADEIIQFLQEYVKVHFRTEEQCMREHNYPLLQLQLEQHARFSKEFSRLAAEIHSNIDKNRLFLQFKTQIFVVDWIVHHTTKLDKHFGKFLKQTKAH